MEAARFGDFHHQERLMKLVSHFRLQIAMKNGVIQPWGLVEFKTAEEAEETRERLDGAIIGGSDQPEADGEKAKQHRIRVQFCVPGMHAINIYMGFVNDPLDAMSGRKALLEEAPSTKVC